jgi:hypothetical protein
VDGATNGTRKLDAYSPTFGGNLTVSGGTVGTAASTNLTLNGGSSGASLVLGQGSSGTATITGKGTTGTTTIAVESTSTTRSIAQLLDVNQATNASLSQGSYMLLGKAASANNSFALMFNYVGAGSSGNALSFQPYGATSVLSIMASGNLLVGTTTDSGNGKLQLATHTTSAGGIGFGTDIALYRAASNTLKMELGVGGGVLWFDNGGSGTGGARILGSSGALTVTSNGANSLYLQTGGTTALTLDSSQRMFVGSAGFGGATSSTLFSGTVTTAFKGSAGGSAIYITDATGSTPGATSPSLYLASSTDGMSMRNASGVLQVIDESAPGAGDGAVRFSVTNAGNATVSGSLAIGNTVQTAAAVASTHKVTISIGGSTYYLLATNV